MPNPPPTLSNPLLIAGAMVVRPSQWWVPQVESEDTREANRLLACLGACRHSHLGWRLRQGEPLPSRGRMSGSAGAIDLPVTLLLCVMIA